MKNKIEQLIPNKEKEQLQIEELRDTIFRNVWNQRKYTNQASISYIFYVMVTKDDDLNTAQDSTEFSWHPVFRCKKCDDQGGDTSNSCMIYVDETGRVYQNWKSYLEENVLPAGTMVLPPKGIYNFSSNNKVILHCCCTPNSRFTAKLYNAVQSCLSVVSIGAVCVTIAGLVIPVAAPFLAAAGVISLSAGACTSVTAVLSLLERKRHELSISITDRQARYHYLNLLAGVAGIALFTATFAPLPPIAALFGHEIYNSIRASQIINDGLGYYFDSSHKSCGKKSNYILVLDPIFKYWMKMAKYFIKMVHQEADNALKSRIPKNSVLYRKLKRILDYNANLIYKYIQRRSEEYLAYIKNIENFNADDDQYELLKECPDCNGMFRICKL